MDGRKEKREEERKEGKGRNGKGERDRGLEEGRENREKMF